MTKAGRFPARFFYTRQLQISLTRAVFSDNIMCWKNEKEGEIV